MRTEYLKYLLEVDRMGTISAAASKLFVRQSTLSAIIGTLEEELGVKIFLRTRKGVVPTPEGELVLAFAADVVGRNDSLLQTLSAKSSIRRLVNLIAYPSACGLLGPALAQSLGEAFSDVCFILHDVSFDKVLPRMADGLASIAVGAEDEEAVSAYRLQAGSYCYEKLFDDHFYLVVSRDSPYAARRRVNVGELVDEHLVFAHYYPSVNDMSVGHVLRRFPKFSVFGSNEVIKKAVLQNNMIALMPGLALHNDTYMEKGCLRCIPLVGFSTKLTNFMLFPAEPDPVETFLLERIREIYKALPTRVVCAE